MLKIKLRAMPVIKLGVLVPSINSILEPDMYTTTTNCVPAVTCRLVNGTRDAVRTIQISSRHPLMHGPPVHISDPTSIGIAIECKVPFMITHYPAHMFVTDWLNEELAVIYNYQSITQRS
jgi:uncharacterized protein YcsI (UPF0317 family)